MTKTNCYRYSYRHKNESLSGSTSKHDFMPCYDSRAHTMQMIRKRNESRSIRKVKVGRTEVLVQIYWWFVRSNKWVQMDDWAMSDNIPHDTCWAYVQTEKEKVYRNRHRIFFYAEQARRHLLATVLFNFRSLSAKYSNFSAPILLKLLPTYQLYSKCMTSNSEGELATSLHPKSCGGHVFFKIITHIHVGKFLLFPSYLYYIMRVSHIHPRGLFSFWGNLNLHLLSLAYIWWEVNVWAWCNIMTTDGHQGDWWLSGTFTGTSCKMSCMNMLCTITMNRHSFITLFFIFAKSIDSWMTYMLTKSGNNKIRRWPQTDFKIRWGKVAKNDKNYRVWMLVHRTYSV